MTDGEVLRRAFAPQSVAIVGSSLREPGHLILEALTASHFQGSIYIVDSQAQEVAGHKSYGNITDIPGPIDYAVCCAPGTAALPLLRDCATKKVAAVAILSAGFSETRTQEGINIEREISALAQGTGMRVLGPNCLGIYSPRTGISFDSHSPAASGQMGLICQGREAFVHIIRAAEYRGVRFSKAISYGNACDVSESELLEYLATDTQTGIVAAVIEVIQDGARFFRVLKSLSESKPVIVLRTAPPWGLQGGAPGTTGIGDGYSDVVWGALLGQTAAVGVNSAEALVDAMVAFAMLPVPSGRRVGIFGAAGGASVLATDAWSSAGFALPPAPPTLRTALDDLAMNQAGMILHNPLDFSMAGYTGFFFDVVKRMLAHEDFVDLGIIHNPSGHGAWLPWAAFDGLIDSIADAAIRIRTDVSRPMALVMHYIASRRHWRKIFEDLQVPCSAAGVPVFYTMASAARAIDGMLRYCERRPATVESSIRHLKPPGGTRVMML